MSLLKTFDDLKFNPHPLGMGGVQALMEFDNGYGVSVVQTPHSYSIGPEEWEVAVLKKGRVCYDSGITDGVLGYQSKKEISEIMSMSLSAIDALIHRAKKNLHKELYKYFDKRL